VIERKHDDLVIDNMKGMTKLAGVADCGEMPYLGLVLAKEIEKTGCRLV